MALYFAYGTNMHRASMRQRCPGGRAIGTGQLAGWRLLVTVDGYVSIARKPGALVHGVLWQLTPRDLAALDIYEAVASGLYRRRVLPVQTRRRQRTAHVYVGRSVTPGRARPGHMAIVIAAAQDWNFPAGYLDELVRWANFRRPENEND